jgi:hypothetical protein
MAVRQVRMPVGRARERPRQPERAEDPVGEEGPVRRSGGPFDDVSQ